MTYSLRTGHPMASGTSKMHSALFHQGVEYAESSNTNPAYLLQMNARAPGPEPDSNAY